jgi:GT2 family glycosyltransferase
MTAPTASIVIPTEGRPDYLRVTLASVLPQARRASAEVLVIARPDDGETAAVAQEFGVGLVPAPAPGTLNASRNAGARAARANLIVLIDDDVQAPPGWLEALLRGVASDPGCDVFGGPIHPRLEGGGPRACGRERPPITSLELGPDDRDVSLVWGANMAIRRQALERIGPFDEAMRGRGDEEDWERRYKAAGGRVRYLPPTPRCAACRWPPTDTDEPGGATTCARARRRRRPPKCGPCSGAYGTSSDAAAPTASCSPLRRRAGCASR